MNTLLVQFLRPIPIGRKTATNRTECRLESLFMAIENKLKIVLLPFDSFFFF